VRGGGVVKEIASRNSGFPPEQPAGESAHYFQ
jgi:hypothetical protein